MDSYGHSSIFDTYCVNPLFKANYLSILPKSGGQPFGLPTGLSPGHNRIVAFNRLKYKAVVS